MSTWLKDHKSLTKAGGTTKLSQLLNQTISATNIDRYVALVLEKYQRRQLIVVANDLQDLAYDNAIELETVFNTSEEKIFNLTTNKQDKFKPLPIGDCLGIGIRENRAGFISCLSYWFRRFRCSNWRINQARFNYYRCQSEYG